MLHTVEYYGFETKIVVASLRSLKQVMSCLELGAHAVTLQPDLFTEIIADNPETLDYVEKFNKAAKEGTPSRLIPT